jgi:DNA-binding transcriptional LysR family regulator
MARIDGIRGIVSFVRTVAAGSFAGAAKDLGITPVAVSKNVQRLEQQVGARLLQRSTRKLSLTAEGRLFYERCAAPLQELERARAAVREKSSSPAGTIRVTSITPFARTYVLPLLPAFSRLYPKIEVELHLDDQLSDMIAEGYDVGIRAGAMRDASIVVRDIAPLHFVVCAAPSYLAQHGVPSTPAELAGHNCLRLCRDGRSDRPLNWMLGPERSPVSPAVRGNFVANDITTLVVAALHGQGLVLAPLPLVLPLFRAGALAPVLPQCVSQPAHIFLHYPNRKLAARVRSFVDFLLDNLRENPDLGADAQSMIVPFLTKSP